MKDVRTQPKHAVGVFGSPMCQNARAIQPNLAADRRISDQHAEMQKGLSISRKAFCDSNGGRDKDRTCDPYDVNVVLSR